MRYCGQILCACILNLLSCENGIEINKPVQGIQGTRREVKAMRAPTNKMRALSAWFLERDHIITPVVDHRLCIDYFVHHVSWLLCLGSFAFAAAVALLGLGSSIYPYILAAVTALMVPLVWYGEWALSKKRAFHSYCYFVLLYWSAMLVLWSGIMGWVDASQVRSTHASPVTAHCCPASCSPLTPAPPFPALSSYAGR